MVLKITTYSEEAAEWIEREAPSFGALGAPDELRRVRMLYVEAGFDLDGVKSWLEETFQGGG